MPNKNVSNFLQYFDGGARPNLFKMSFAGLPDTVGINSDTLEVYCKAASLPSSVTGVINLNYRGRVIQMPGDRTFEDWTITVLNDESMVLKRAFVAWQASYNDHVANQPATGALKDHVQAIKNCSATVHQLDRMGESKLSYELHYVWCDNVSATDVSYDTVDSVSEFTVTLKYHDYTMLGGDTSAV